MNYMKALLAALALLLVNSASAAGAGTAAEATALVKSAIQYIKSNGREKAFAEFSNPAGKFRDRDLYILVFDMSGVAMAHGAQPRLIGKPVAMLKDSDGKLIFKAYVDEVNAKGSGWVDYRWPNPVSGNIEKKSTYVEKYESLIVGAGIYKD